MPGRGKAAVAVLGGLLAGAVWWRRNPSACPYSQRVFVEMPHPLVTRRRLREVLEPAPGERVLEIGPGTGYYSLTVAQWLSPGGRLDVLDVQREMLDHTMREARRRGIDNVEATLGDARAMPYEDDTFDRAFLVTVLGEVPDQDAALRELRRVVRPGGRVVFGEVAFDPHIVFPGALRRRAEAAGLEFERRSGPPLGFFASFRVPEDT